MNRDLPTLHVRIRSLSKSYREGTKQHAVLCRVTADFAHGETVALRGRSGSGKSTLLNLLSGIDAPDEGEVSIAGAAITAMSERERTLFRRRNIGFVYQAFNLVPTLTAADNVRLVLELNSVPEPQATERVIELLDAVGLGDRQDSYPDILSGGEQQRVAIARALAHKPSLVLADEPTGNLDDVTAENVLTLLDSLVRAEGGTMIVATHSAAVAAFCDRVLELRDGRLVDHAPGQ
ncbi:MAG TPA: ABC transporter ATP-binding protein [Woeseiaceae bacterium]|nr:ABC transporter ATP-binding protein [Woeseiaceae bacterium]